MAVNNGEIAIYGVLVNDTDKGIIAKSEQLFDSAIGKKQSEINKQLLDNLGGSSGTITGLTSVGENYLKDTSIGAPCEDVLSKNVIIGENAKIGNRVIIGSDTSINETMLHGVTISDTIISNNVINVGNNFVLTNQANPRDIIHVDFYGDSIKLTQNDKHSLVIGTCNEELLSTNITTTYITGGVYIGDIGTITMSNRDSYNVFIGSGVNISHDVTVAETVNIGSSVSIGSSVNIQGVVNIGNNVNIEQGVNITSTLYQKLRDLPDYETITNQINEVKDMAIGFHITTNASVAPAIIYKGENTNVNISYSASISGKPLTCTATLDSENGEAVSNPYSVSDNRTFKVYIHINNEDPNVNTIVSKTLRVNAYYPRYYGVLNSETITSNQITTLTKMTAAASAAASNVKTTVTESSYLWLCVPNGMTINKVTSSGFDVPMSSPINVEVTNKGTYKCYRSTNKINSGSITYNVQ